MLGAAVGFIPGIAVTYPAHGGRDASNRCSRSVRRPSVAYLDIPWLMILGLVVVLPLLTAAVVALFTRSRMPLVARLD